MNMACVCVCALGIYGACECVCVWGGDIKVTRQYFLFLREKQLHKRDSTGN